MPRARILTVFPGLKKFAGSVTVPVPVPMSVASVVFVTVVSAVWLKMMPGVACLIPPMKVINEPFAESFHTSPLLGDVTVAPDPRRSCDRETVLGLKISVPVIVPPCCCM